MVDRPMTALNNAVMPSDQNTIPMRLLRLITALCGLFALSAVAAPPAAYGAT